MSWVVDFEQLRLPCLVKLAEHDHYVGSLRAHEITIAEADSNREVLVIEQAIWLAECMVGLEKVLEWLSINCLHLAYFTKHEVFVCSHRFDHRFWIALKFTLRHSIELSLPLLKGNWNQSAKGMCVVLSFINEFVNCLAWGRLVHFVLVANAVHIIIFIRLYASKAHRRGKEKLFYSFWEVTCEKTKLVSSVRCSVHQHLLRHNVINSWEKADQPDEHLLVCLFRWLKSRRMLNPGVPTPCTIVENQHSEMLAQRFEQHEMTQCFCCIAMCHHQKRLRLVSEDKVSGFEVNTFVLKSCPMSFNLVNWNSCEHKNLSLTLLESFLKFRSRVCLLNHL